MNPPLLQTERLKLSIQQRTLLRDISFSVYPGELVGLIGPNGAGKSSLLKALIGLHTKRTGEILIQGRDLDEFSAVERAAHISYLAQSHDMSFSFRVRETILLGAHSRQSTASLPPKQLERELTEITQLLDIAHLLDRRLDQLSGGEQQLVNFARILIQDSPLMLLDEPTASLDVGHEAQLMNLLHQQCRQGRSALVAIHNLNSAAAFCDRLLLINDGAIIADGNPEQVITQSSMQPLYGPSVLVSRNPMTGSTTVLPLVETPASIPLHVHLIGGAGSTVALCRQLLQMGIRVTAGIGHDQDSDTQLWEALGVEHVKVPTFSPITQADIDAAQTMVHQADITLMTDFPIGAMNAGNLQLAEQATHLWILHASEDTDSRFYDDESLHRYQQLCRRHEVHQLSPADALTALRARATQLRTPAKTGAESTDR